jgi:hypothetical protein
LPQGDCKTISGNSILLLNEKANQPLIHAAYENHHTRELDGKDEEAAIQAVNAYIEDKAEQVEILPWMIEEDRPIPWTIQTERSQAP